MICGLVEPSMRVRWSLFRHFRWHTYIQTYRHTCMCFCIHDERHRGPKKWCALCKLGFLVGRSTGTDGWQSSKVAQQSPNKHLYSRHEDSKVVCRKLLDIAQLWNSETSSRHGFWLIEASRWGTWYTLGWIHHLQNLLVLVMFLTFAWLPLSLPSAKSMEPHHCHTWWKD